MAKKKHDKEMATPREDYRGSDSFNDLEPLPTFPVHNPRDALLEDNLSQEVESDNSIKSVSKELFNKESIDLKTEVTHDEINHLTRMRFLEQKFQTENIDVLINSFLRLRVSKNRKSRAEFINALQTENRNAQGSGFSLSKLFGGGSNNNP